jgi:hypothetical protein
VNTGYILVRHRRCLIIDGNAGRFYVPRFFKHTHI